MHARVQVSVIHPQPRVDAGRRGLRGVHVLPLDVQRNTNGCPAVAVGKKVLRHGQGLLNKVGRASVLVVIAVAGKAERPVAVQAVVAALVLFMDETRGRRHRRRDGLRGDLLFGGGHALPQRVQILLVRLARDHELQVGIDGFYRYCEAPIRRD